IEWRIYNTRGLALMFGSDYEPDLVMQLAEMAHVNSQRINQSRLKLLFEAHKHFQRADQASPCNWAIRCNLGSVNMRIAYWLREKGEERFIEHFKVAAKYLEEVFGEIRPNYAFAAYELGRLERLRGNYASALEWLELSKQTPAPERDVSDRTIDPQISRAR